MENDRRSEKLVEEIAQGSKEAFETLYEIYHPFVLQIAYQIIGDANEAEDICHDVFLEVYEKIDEYKPNRGSVKAWLAVKTKSRSIDRLRKKQPILIEKLESTLTNNVQAADVYVLSLLEREVILDALEKIPENQRKAIYESYFGGKTHKEIANSMNKPLGTVKSFIRYGLMNLKKQKVLMAWITSGGGERGG